MAVPLFELAPRWLDAWSGLLGGGPAVVASDDGDVPRARVPAAPEAEPDLARRFGSHVPVVRARSVFTLATMLSAICLDAGLVNEEIRRSLPRRRLPHRRGAPGARPGPAGRRRAHHVRVRPRCREELLATGRRTDVVLRVVSSWDRGIRRGTLADCPGCCAGATVHRLPPVDAESGPWLMAESAVLHALSGPFLKPAREVDEALAAAQPMQPPAARTAPRHRHHTRTTHGTHSTQRCRRPAPGDADRAGPIAGRGGPGDAAAGPGEHRGQRTYQEHAHDLGKLRPGIRTSRAARNSSTSCAQRLLREKATAVLPHTLHGMGGVGKSLLAVEYLYRRMAEYNVVWWISAERTAQISPSLVELAPRLGLPTGSDVSSTVASVLEALRIGVPHANWILVFDNAGGQIVGDYLHRREGRANILVACAILQWASVARPLEK